MAITISKVLNIRYSLSIGDYRRLFLRRSSCHELPLAFAMALTQYWNSNTLPRHTISPLLCGFVLGHQQELGLGGARKEKKESQTPLPFFLGGCPNKKKRTIKATQPHGCCIWQAWTSTPWDLRESKARRSQPEATGCRCVLFFGSPRMVVSL